MTTRQSVIRMGNLFAIPGFFLHPLLHWWVRNSPELETAMHGFVSPSISMRFFLAWLAEIAVLWIVGALIGFLAVRLRGGRDDHGRGERP